MPDGGNSDEAPTPESTPESTQADRWEALLEQMADDVRHIRRVIVRASYVGMAALVLLAAWSLR